jgi:hypothetical protein
MMASMILVELLQQGQGFIKGQAGIGDTAPIFHIYQTP